MALHGEIKINGDIIQYWSAVRQDHLVSVEQESEYECTFGWTQPYNGKVVFPIWHRYDRGAAELARRVIFKGEALMAARLEVVRP